VCTGAVGPGPRRRLATTQTVNRSPTPESLDAATAARLLDLARAARDRAYAPYSHFPVGAAALTDSGEVFTGCNVENASFSLTNCAERVAVQRAVSDGHRRIRAVAVVGPDDDARCAPCGSCRQVLHEFGPEMDVITPGGPGRAADVAPLARLLPGAFGPDSLPGAPR
jgi:cytidine deaminase